MAITIQCSGSSSLQIWQRCAEIACGYCHRKVACCRNSHLAGAVAGKPEAFNLLAARRAKWAGIGTPIALCGLAFHYEEASIVQILHVRYACWIGTFGQHKYSFPSHLNANGHGRSVTPVTSHCADRHCEKFLSE